MDQKSKEMARNIAKNIISLNDRGDTVLRDQNIKSFQEIPGISFYPDSRPTVAEFRGDRIPPIHYRTPAGGHTWKVWTAIEKWASL